MNHKIVGNADDKSVFESSQAVIERLAKALIREGNKLAYK